MKRIILLCFLLTAVSGMQAQDIVLTRGKIEFEKKINLHHEIDDLVKGGSTWLGDLKKSIPEYNVSYFNLYFDNGITVYKPGREVVGAQKGSDWFIGPARDNTVYHDLNREQSVSLKNVYEASFLIEDSIRKIKWQITFDKRNIAGFDCRKAVARIMDSVYVIAFYTDEISTSGGPESFCGLPGMILGIAIPRINSTWFATKVELATPAQSDLAAPRKGKKVNNLQLMEELKAAMKDWGASSQRNIWRTML